MAESKTCFCAMPKMAAPTASTMEETSAASRRVKPRCVWRMAYGVWRERESILCVFFSIPNTLYFIRLFILFLAHSVVDPPVHVFRYGKRALLYRSRLPGDCHRDAYFIGIARYGIGVDSPREVRRRPGVRIVADPGISVQGAVGLKRRAFSVAPSDGSGSIPLAPVDRERFVQMRDEAEDVRRAGRVARDDEYLGIADAPQRFDCLLRKVKGGYLVAGVVGGAETL